MENKPEIQNNTSFSFKKGERLCSKKTIDKLFTTGDSFLVFPVKVVYLKTDLPTEYPAQVGFSVSKKNFKRAVKRNRIKRLLREAYRLNKNQLYDFLQEEQLAIFFIFIGKEVPSYTQIDKAMKKALKKILRSTSGSDQNKKAPQ